MVIVSALFHIGLHTFSLLLNKNQQPAIPLYASMKQELTNRKAAPTLYRIRNPQKPRLRNPQKHRFLPPFDIGSEWKTSRSTNKEYTI
jgi:hypothetical protein